MSRPVASKAANTRPHMSPDAARRGNIVPVGCCAMSRSQKSTPLQPRRPPRLTESCAYPTDPPSNPLPSAFSRFPSSPHISIHPVTGWFDTHLYLIPDGLWTLHTSSNHSPRKYDRCVRGWTAQERWLACPRPLCGQPHAIPGRSPSLGRAALVNTQGRVAFSWWSQLTRFCLMVWALGGGTGGLVSRRNWYSFASDQ